MRRLLPFVALAGLFASPAFAQSTYPTPAGSRVQGVVNLVCDASGANCAPAGTTTAGADKVQGDTASGAADAGNPVKIGGLVSPTTGGITAATAGQRTNASFDRYGAQRVQPTVISTGGVDAFANSNLGYFGADYAADSSARSLAGVAGFVFNGTSWDRQRGTTDGTFVVEVPSANSAAGVTTVASTAVSGGQVIKASAGNLYGFNVVSGASAGYVLIFNSTTVPADGAVTPVRCLPLAANTGLDVNLRGQPTFFSTGISISFSTTGCFTKTASATAFIAADAK